MFAPNSTCPKIETIKVLSYYKKCVTNTTTGLCYYFRKCVTTMTQMEGACGGYAIPLK